MVNRFYKKQIQHFEPCAGTVIGTGGKVIGAIVGRGYVQVLGYSMPVYYGSDLPNSMFSVGVFVSVSKFGLKITCASFGILEN